MNARHVMPNRRRSDNSELTIDGSRYMMTAGYRPDGELGEIFLTADRSNSLLDVLVSDAAILVSLCLQHGVQLSTIRHAMKRNAAGTAASPIGAALDHLVKPIGGAE